MGIEFMILNWIQSIRTPVGDVLMPLISKFASGGIIWIILAVILLIIPKTRKSGIILVVALCLNVVICNVILKDIFCRVRPCNVNTQIALLVARPSSYSFPSGHTAAAFTAVAALYFAGEKHLWKIVAVVAVLIAFSRMYLYVHYPTDILGGIVAGIVLGYVGYWLVNKLEQWNKNRKKKQA